MTYIKIINPIGTRISIIPTRPYRSRSYIQKERVIQYCEELFIRQFKDEIIEADDGIAYYCSQIKEDEKVVIVTNDRDMCTTN